MRLIFMGTPDFAVPTLVELAAHGHEIVAVYTREPKAAGRGMEMQETPVAREAAPSRRPRERGGLRQISWAGLMAGTLAERGCVGKSAPVNRDPAGW